jgi:hypothetical protein
MTDHSAPPSGRSQEADDQLLKRCRRRLRELLPVLPTSLEDLRATMQEIRGRRIDLEITDPGRLKLPSGLWGQLGRRDLIWVDRRTSPLGRMVVACHEFGHMICGHQTQPLPSAVADPAPVADLAAGLSLDPAHLTAIVGRCGEPAEPGTPEWRREREAELTGRILAQHILTVPGSTAHRTRSASRR